MQASIGTPSPVRDVSSPRYPSIRRSCRQSDNIPERDHAKPVLGVLPEAGFSAAVIMLLFECRAGGVRFCGEFREFILQRVSGVCSLPSISTSISLRRPGKRLFRKRARFNSESRFSRGCACSRRVFSLAPNSFSSFITSASFLVKFRVKMVFFFPVPIYLPGLHLKNGGIEEHIELFDSYAEYAGEEEVAEFMDYHQNRES